MDFNAYKPGIHKLLQHPDHLLKVKRGEAIAPLHVSFWPTIRCQSNCSYCCCRNEDHSAPDLPFIDFLEAINVFSTYGTKAIEFAGGGEPLLWPEFEKAASVAWLRGMKLSLVTNGLALQDVSEDVLKNFSWIRVSLQSAEHGRQVFSGKLPAGVRISASYIASSSKELAAIADFAHDFNVVTRIAVPQPVPPGLEPLMVEEVAKALGAPLFFARKPQGTPSGCYMAWIRAAVDWRGYFLPCPSVMLVPGRQGAVDASFRLCHVHDLAAWIESHRPADLGFRCGFCNCGKDHNELMHGILKEEEDAEFV
jgi:hypothetical protein